VYEPGRLKSAWQQAKKNDGSAGIDNMSIKGFEERLVELARLIVTKLKSGTYRFKPAKRVYIKKENSNKKRPLGIPVVMDRIVSQSMKTVLEEIFDKDFTDSNYGFRKGKRQVMAVEHVKKLFDDGYKWCASVDLKSFFDEIPHDLILKLIRRKISDESFVTLVARALKSGVIIDGKFEKSTKGCPQGSPVSPILSNIVLNELDHELERRRLKYCRWADDFVILVKTERSAKRVLESISRYLENELGLIVNAEKSKAVKVIEITFLGIQFSSVGNIKISDKSLKKFRDKVRKLTKRNNPKSMHQIIKELNWYIRGWVNYFKMQDLRKPLYELDCWIRQRLRIMQLRKWKKPKKFQKVLIKSGFDVAKAKRTWVKMKSWQSINRLEVKYVLNNEWFRKYGLVFLHDFTKVSLVSE
jgi:group II intron reverse transcriptase/maturase